jgi:phenylpropionate dioxygenase-like ring-hydroxylating dioxygenase large terminal subunit
VHRFCGVTVDLRRVAIDPDRWYPLARSSELEKEKLLGVTFAGEPIVLGRTASGRAFALEDRCAHRQVPLHLGAVSGERVACAYHAWCYDTSGKLAGIPYLDKGGPKPPRGVRSYPCREAYGHLFVFAGERDRAEQTAFPALAEWSSPHHRAMLFSRTIQCHYSLMHENLMDMNHQFLHRRHMGKIQPILLGYERGEDWIEARYRFARVGGRGHLGARAMLAAEKRRSAAERDGDLDLMTIRTDYPYQGLTVQRAGSDEPAFKLWAAYVPLDREQRTNQSFGILMIKKPRPAIAIHALWPLIRWFTEAILREDKMIVEEEQRAHDRQGADWNQEVFPLVLDLREILSRNGARAGSALQTGAEFG